MLVGIVQRLLQGAHCGRLLLLQLGVIAPLQLQPLISQGLM